MGGTEVGRLFELLGSYGGNEAVPQLKKRMEKWRVYAAVVLAGLPDGAGSPA